MHGQSEVKNDIKAKKKKYKHRIKLELYKKN